MGTGTRMLSRLVLVVATSFSASVAQAAYWNVFNIEGESSLSANIVTYASLADALTDTNRTGVYEPNPFGFGVNIVGSGSDGTAYWNVFNIEGESSLSANIVTYASLTDMLTDTNRTGVYEPNPFGFGVNIVGGGSDGMRVNGVPEPGTLALLMLCLATLTPFLRARSAIPKSSCRRTAPFHMRAALPHS